MHFIERGAEAILYKKNSHLIKKRISKGYRIEQLDKKLRKSRTLREVKLMVRARRNGVNVPVIIEKDMDEYKIKMEFIDGKNLKNELEKLKGKKIKEVCKSIGNNISKLHSANIVHGDLTTSNMILKDDNVYIIDFGLGKFSKKIEDFAVDILLMKRALISKHNKIWKNVFKNIIKNYNFKEKKKVLERIKKIEKRVRYS